MCDTFRYTKLITTMKGYAVIVAALTVAIPASGIPRGTPVRAPECPSSGTVRIPHPTDCTLYYVCQDGKSTIHMCPEGLHFNNAIKQCDWPPAGCYPGMNRPETQPNIPDEEEDNSPDCIGTCPIPDPKDKTIHLPYRGDCNKFCKCSNGVPYVMNCPDGLHFDKNESVCNWPWVANC